MCPSHLLLSFFSACFLLFHSTLTVDGGCICFLCVFVCIRVFQSEDTTQAHTHTVRGKCTKERRASERAEKKKIKERGPRTARNKRDGSGSRGSRSRPGAVPAAQMYKRFISLLLFSARTSHSLSQPSPLFRLSFDCRCTSAAVTLFPHILLSAVFSRSSSHSPLSFASSVSQSVCRSWPRYCIRTKVVEEGSNRIC